VKVRLENSLSDNLKEGFTKDFENSALVAISAQNPEILIERVPAITLDSLQVYTVQDGILFKKKIDQAKTGELVTAAGEEIRNYARVKFIRNIDQKNSDMDVRFELIPVKMKAGVKGVVEEILPRSTKMNKSGLMDFKEGDYFIFKFKNFGNSTAFFNVIDIQPDNKIDIIVPVKDKNATQLKTSAECMLKPGDSMLVIKQAFKIGPPYGKETLMLIAAPEALNLDFITSRGTRGVKGSKAYNPFEALYSESQKDVKSRGPAPEIPAATVNINTMEFIISPRK
jgi:hypothetical protein